MRARRTAERGPGRRGAAPRGRRAGHGDRAPHPRDVPARLQVRPRLGSVRRARAGPRRPAAVPAARARDRRLGLDQRDDLPPRPSRRLRRLGGGRLHRLVVRRGASLLQALRGQRARCERVPWRRWTAHGVRQPLHVPPDRGPARGRRASGVRAHRGPQRRLPGGRFPLPADPAERPAVQHRGCVPPPCRRAAEPRGARERLRRADRLRGRPRGGRRARLGRRPRDRPGRARGDRLRGHVPVAGAADALGHRARRRPRVLRHPGAGGPAGRAQPAGPLHGERELPHGRARPLRHLHGRELRAPRAARAAAR